MTTHAQKIRMALACIRMSESELARSIGTTPQAFHQRLKTDKFSTEELERIAAAMGATYKAEFVLGTGEVI